MKFKISVIIIMIIKDIYLETNASGESSSSSKNDGTELLSRRKRFLIFPEGSSVQIVFCAQNHGHLQIGDIVWFGSTAALAWELPTDPEVYDMFRDHSKVFEANRRTNVIYYLDESGKVVDSNEYRRKNIINPAFAKRSVERDQKSKITRQSIKEMHKRQKEKQYFQDIDASKFDYIMREKLYFYNKLEDLLQISGWSKECILEIIRRSNHKNNTGSQGTFLEEIIKPIFTLPNDHALFEEHNRSNDAHGTNGDWDGLYQKCGYVQ